LEKSEYPATCTSEEVVRPTKERVQRQRVTGESVRVKIFFYYKLYTRHSGKHVTDDKKACPALVGGS
jgi:hypothetical protein